MCEFCVISFIFDKVLFVCSSCVIILLIKRELVALLQLCFAGVYILCLEWLGLLAVIVVFPYHTYLL